MEDLFSVSWRAFTNRASSGSSCFWPMKFRSMKTWRLFLLATANDNAWLLETYKTGAEFAFKSWKIVVFACSASTLIQLGTAHHVAFVNSSMP